MHLHLAGLGLALALLATPTTVAGPSPDDDPVAWADPDPAVVRSRPIELGAEVVADLATGRSTRIDLDLFDDLAISVVIEGEIRRTERSVTLLGSLAIDPTATVMISIHDQAIRASIDSRVIGSHVIRSTEDGRHVVETVAIELQPDCGFTAADIEPFRPSLAPLPTMPAGGIAGGGACVEDGSVIDMLVVYSDDAAVAGGGTAAMAALINLCIDQANLAFANSGIPTTVRLAGTQEVAFTESSSSGAMLSTLIDPADGVLDEVHALRDTLHADVVSLIVAGGDVCGIARLSIAPGPTPRPDDAFNVVTLPCAAGPTRAFVHELGHNLGCMHDWAEGCNAGGTTYAMAHVEPGEFATVMATGGTPETRIDHFSSPAVLSGGFPTGIPAGQLEAADNASAIMLSAPMVASFRSLDCNGNGVCDDDDITSATSQDCNANGIPDECEADCNGNGVPDDCDLSGGGSVDGNGNGLLDECEATRLYVDATATGADLGTSWADALTDLQAALGVAHAPGSIVQEIWVAAGTYTPGPAPHRAASFTLASGLALYGGFAGGETDLEQRDIAANVTTLSADLLGDDGPDFAGIADNALTVVVGSGVDATAVLDGFTVAGGHTDVAFTPCYFTPYAGGGGIRIHGGSPTVRDCRVVANTAMITGGGLYVRYTSDPVFERCDFVDNRATGDLNASGGGAALNPDGGHTVTMIDCRFIGNHSNGSAGGISNVCEECEYIGCSFLGNTADYVGGGVRMGGSFSYAPTFTNCIFVGNYGTVGGAMYSYGAGGHPKLQVMTNCTIVGNSAAGAGGLSFGSADTPTIDNCLIWGNWTTGSGSMSESAQMTNWGQSISSSTIQGWTGALGGVNNDGLDPLFADVDGPDDVLGTDDDDVTLTAASPAIDSGDDALLPADTRDLDGDGDTTEPLPIDVIGNTRVIDGDGDMVATVDRGAHELGPAVVCLGDIDGDTTVATTDLLALLAAWGVCPGCDEDLDGDGQVATTDLLSLLAAWGTCP